MQHEVEVEEEDGELAAIGSPEVAMVQKQKRVAIAVQESRGKVNAIRLTPSYKRFKNMEVVEIFMKQLLARKLFVLPV